MNGLTQSAFARRMGCSRSYIGRLLRAGRLVLTPTGRIDPEASLARLQATAEIPHRSKILAAAAETAVGAGDLRHWRTRREIAEADLAEAAHRAALGEIVPGAIAEDEFRDRAVQARARIEALPTRIVWLAASGAIADELQREVDEIVTDMARPLDLPTTSPTTGVMP